MKIFDGMLLASVYLSSTTDCAFSLYILWESSGEYLWLREAYGSCVRDICLSYSLLDTLGNQRVVVIQVCSFLNWGEHSGGHSVCEFYSFERDRFEDPVRWFGEMHVSVTLIFGEQQFRERTPPRKRDLPTNDDHLRLLLFH
jgi:hypothetical protein